MAIHADKIMEKEDALILASRYYLCEELPETYVDFDADKLDQFIESNAWQPFEFYPAVDIWDLINDLADEFVRVSK